jgi:methylenetetrahydrofolate dehydrogenase (NADP+) / methenyltetrahydrofolate cyclohydrolase
LTARIIDGKLISASIKEELKERLNKLSLLGVAPGLSGVLVGEDPGSATYVGLKEKVSAELGVSSAMLRLPADITQNNLLAEIERLNTDASIHGIFLQLPLPEHLNENVALCAVSPYKDVDGFHPINIGRAWMGQPAFIPAGAIAIHEMILRSGFNPEGKEVVIVGVDELVGKPLASILVQDREGSRANVTLCNPCIENLAYYTLRADILVVAANRPRFITADMVKDGVVVLDAGSNWQQDPVTKKNKTIGDVDFDSVGEKAKAITPVPGGVGPMLITMLMSNTILAAERVMNS